MTSTVSPKSWPQGDDAGSLALLRTALAASQSAGQDEVWRDTEGRVSAAHRSMMMIGGANIQSQIQDNGSFGALAASLALPIDETGTIQLSRTLQALDLYGLQ